MAHWELIGILTEDLCLRFTRRLFALWQLLIKTCDTRHAWGPLVSDCPLRKQLLAFLPDFGIRHRVGSCNPKSFQEGLVRELAEESVTSILDEVVQNGQCAQLPVKIAILPARYKT